MLCVYVQFQGDLVLYNVTDGHLFIINYSIFQSYVVEKSNHNILCLSALYFSEYFYMFCGLHCQFHYFHFSNMGLLDSN